MVSVTSSWIECPRVAMMAEQMTAWSDMQRSDEEYQFDYRPLPRLGDIGADGERQWNKH
jgi:hypothetical protein